MNARAVPHDRSKKRLWIAAASLLVLGAVFCQSALSQEQEAPRAPLTPAELEELVGPVALYPDDLLGIVLPASTYPLQIVQAARFLEDRASDSTLTPNEEWDDSIVALLNYPEVVRMMNEDLEWTWALGEAVLDDQSAVLDAVQTFRDRAYAAGNLETDEKQVVTEDDGVIEIAPADPEVVYIPYYEPERVVVYQPSPVYYYYPYAYPLYYYPYPWNYHFASPYFWGVTSAFVIGWHSHFLHVHHHTHFGHPYYGYNYYTNGPYYWRYNSHPYVNRVANVWEPTHRRGAQPHYRNDGRRVRTTYEGYDGTRRQVSNGSARTLQGGDASRPATGAHRTASAPRRTIGGVASANGTRTSVATESRTARTRPGTTRRVESSEQPSTARGAEGSAPRTIGGVANQSAARREAAPRTTAPTNTPRTSRTGVPRPNGGDRVARSVEQRRSGGLALRTPPVQRSAPITRTAPVERQAPAQRSASVSRSAPERSSPVQRSAPASSAPALQSAPQSATPRSMSGAQRSGSGSSHSGAARGGSGQARGGRHSR